MKKIILPLLALCALWATASAQVPDAVSMKNSRDAERNFCLDAVKPGPGVYSVLVRYPRAMGGPKVYFDTVSVSRRFTLLTNVPREMQALGRQSIEAVLGNAWGAVDTSILYRLPYSVHKRDALYTLAVEGGWASHVFSLAAGDTVFAARRGTVVCVRPIEKSVNLRGLELIVQHVDGSWASYRGLAAGSAMIAPGQTVWPDTPIGLAGNNRRYGWSVLLTLKYPTLIERRGRGEFIFENLNPAFASSSFEQLPGKGRRWIFTPRVDYELITREMTDRDAEQMKAMPEAQGR